MKAYSRADAYRLRPSIELPWRKLRDALSTCLALALLAGCVGAPPQPVPGRLLRAQALALLQTVNVELLSHPSATLTLERWCADHHLAQPATIIVRRLHDRVKPLPPAWRARLEVGTGARIGYRHVQLMCGSRVLSDADNWYLPGRLTEWMNRQLDSTDQPFGKVVRALHFQRRTLSSRLLWSPLPRNWELSAAPGATGPMRIPRYVLRHEAILYTSGQLPFSAVVETYTNELFDFGRWTTYLDHG